MSVKSSNRSLVSSDSKRATKTLSCMRGAKLCSILNATAPAKLETTSTPDTDIKKLQLSPPSLKQEPDTDEDFPGFYEENDIPGDDEDPDGSSFSSLTRVRSHSRSLRAMANPSAVWAHFDLCSNDPLRAQCRICGVIVVRGGANPRQCGTTNLHRHLRVHHGGRLIGKRYHVMSDLEKRDPELNTPKALRMATQSLVRQMRQIAPAPLKQPAQRQPEQQQHQQNREHHKQQHQQQQHQKPTKTLMLKTIPSKMKQDSSSNAKLPQRPSTHHGLSSSRQSTRPQPPTEVCLRWNSYHSNMEHCFPSLLDSEQFVDVTLACEGRSLKCHKMILSSCSDYLAQLLRENPCQHPIILMKDLKFWEVEALVKFMYRGEVNVTHDKLPQLLNAAEALQVKGLAGPSNSQNPMPSPLKPKSKSHNSVPQQTPNRVANETKDKPSTSTNNSVPSIALSSSSKRGQKRRSTPSEIPEARRFNKIRLQHPTSMSQDRHRSFSPTAVKLEPADMPMSPREPVYHDDGREEEDSGGSNPPSFDNPLVMHEEDDPGGDELELADAGSELDEIDDPRSNNFNEEQMEFVPTDFLDQQHDIVEDLEDRTNCNRTRYEGDSKHNNDEIEEDDEEEYEDEEDKSDEEARPDRTKKDET